MYPPNAWLEVGHGCSQISWTTSLVSTRTATRMRSRSSTLVPARSCSRRALRQIAMATGKRSRLVKSTRLGVVSSLSRGTGSFGAGLTRFLTGRGERVLEVGRLRRERRSGDKTDALDAIRAARSVLASERPATTRVGGERQALQALVAAREGAVNAKRAGLCQLRDLLITTPSRCAASCGRYHARGSCNASRQTGQTADVIQSCAGACSHCAPSRDASCN